MGAILLIYGGILCVLFNMNMGVYGVRDTVTYEEQAVIVLGAGIKGNQVSRTLQLRLDKTIEYAQKNPNALIVVSGGQGPQETVTEACAMEKYLLENGIRAERILKEEQATPHRKICAIPRPFWTKDLPRPIGSR